MTTIILSQPAKNSGQWAVFGLYSGPDDRYVFAVRKFDAGRKADAEVYARKMMEVYQADHFERS